MKKKTVYLLFFLITVLAVVLLVKLFAKPSLKQIEENTVPIFKPSASTSSQYFPGNEPPIISGPLKILKDNTKKEPILLNEQIILTFNKPISANDLAVELQPPTPIKVSVDSSSTGLIIEPATGWEFKTNYTIKVSKNSTALDKSQLDKDYEFHFSTVRYIGY